MYYVPHMQTELKKFSGRTLRISVIATIFVVLALNGIASSGFLEHGCSLQQKCAISKSQGATVHSTILKHAQIAVLGQRLFEFHSPVSFLLNGHQDTRPLASLTASIVFTRAPPARCSLS